MASFRKKDTKRIADAVRWVESQPVDARGMPNARKNREYPSSTFGVKVWKDGGSQASVAGSTAATWTYTCKSPSGFFTYGTGKTPEITALQIRKPKVQIDYAPDGTWGIGCKNELNQFVLLECGESEQIGDICEEA